MQLLGLTGSINHGKTTLAKFLLAEEPYSKIIESWQVIAEVAEELNRHFDATQVSSSDITSINSWLFHLLDILPGVVNVRPSFDTIEIREHELDAAPKDFEKLFIYIDRLKDNPGLATESIEHSNKEDHRPILQWLGNYVSSAVGESVWFDEIMRRVLLADDSVKLYIVSGLRYPADAARMRRHGAKIVEVIRPNFELRDIEDPTESNRKFIDPDCTIVNNGDLKDLEDVAKAMMVDLEGSTLRYEYRAVN